MPPKVHQAYLPQLGHWYLLVNHTKRFLVNVTGTTPMPHCDFNLRAKHTQPFLCRLTQRDCNSECPQCRCTPAGTDPWYLGYSLERKMCTPLLEESVSNCWQLDIDMVKEDDTFGKRFQWCWQNSWTWCPRSSRYMPPRSCA